MSAQDKINELIAKQGEANSVDPTFLGSVLQALLDREITLADLTWLISTDVFSAPVIAYASNTLDVNSTGTINPIVISGTQPFTSYQITSGTLPTGFSFDTNTGVISYVAGSSADSGSFGVTASNPVGDSAEATVNWEIRAYQGVAEATNTLVKYPAMRVTTSNSTDDQPLLKIPFHGTVNSSGVITQDAGYPIYVASNGDGTYTYMINRNTSTYWYLYVGSNTDPATLVNGGSTDLTTSLSYDLVCPNSNDVVVDGIAYPSDQTDVHYITSFNYMRLGNDATLDNFMTDAAAWSFGFRLQEDWTLDGLGRAMFTREGRNWSAMTLAHSSTYTDFLYGNGASIGYTSSEDFFPSGGISSGSYIKVTFDGSVLRVYVDGVRLYQTSSIITAYWDGASANSLDVLFGFGVASNTIPTSNTYYHGFWQGLIDRMWIVNGAVEVGEDNGTTFPAGTTHSWLLNETDTNTFAADTGSVSITAEKFTF